MNDALFAPLSNFRERESQQADRHIKQNVIEHREGGPRALETTKRRDEA